MDTLNLQIPAPNYQTVKVNIVGDMPIIFHRFSDKARKMIEDKQAKKASSNVRPKRDPKGEADDAMYWTSDKKAGFPALSFKHSIINAARNIDGLPMTILWGNIFVIADDKSTGMVYIKNKKLDLRTDMVRVGRGAADVRYRNQALDWSSVLTIEYNADVLSAEQVVNLVAHAGKSVGGGDWRPQKKGLYGTWKIT